MAVLNPSTFWYAAPVPEPAPVAVKIVFGVGCAVTVVEPAVMLLSRLYVPVPPVPVPKDEILVPAVMPVPLMAMPTVKAPDVTAVTVRTVPATEPVTTAVDAAPTAT